MSENRVTGKKHPRDEEEGGEEVGEGGEEVTPHPVLKSCIVCLDTQEMTTNLITSHQCQQCKPDSWFICIKCEDSLYSKLCPICRTDYAPLKYYQFSPFPLPLVANESKDEDEDDEQKRQEIKKQQNKEEILYQNALNLTKISLIQFEKIGIWCPMTTPPVIHFSLPQDLTVSPREMKFLHVTLPITDPNELQRLQENSTTQEPMFLFTNSVWDRLDAILEGGTELSSRDVSISHDVSSQEVSSQSQEVILSPREEISSSVLSSVPAAAAGAAAAALAVPVEGGEILEEAQEVTQGGEGGEGEGDDEDCPQLLGIKETLQRIVALLATEGTVFLTPLNSSEATVLLESYLAPS